MSNRSQLNFDLFYQNIDFLLKERKIKIGEFENKVSLSTGYLSRLKNGSTISLPSITVIKNIADFFDFSIDTLLCVDCKQASQENSLPVIEYLTRLHDRTKLGELKWSAEPIKTSPHNPSLFLKEYRSHPLFEELYIEKDEAASRYLSQFARRDKLFVLSNSIRNGYEYYSEGSLYRACMAENTFLVLADITPYTNSEKLFPCTFLYNFLELYIIKDSRINGNNLDGGNVIKVCHSFVQDQTTVKKPLFSLYQSVKEAVNKASTQPELEAEAKNILDNYLHN